MRYICTAVVATLVLAGTSFAATINVPGDYTLIQDAINASSDFDVIAIEAGTYYEHSLNPNGKAITIGSASGNLDVTIDAQQGGSVFMIDSGEGNGTVIENLVITGATGTDVGDPGTYGGGIACSNSSNPTISDCTISGNTAGDGGGIYCYDNSSPTITNCTITDNTAEYGGGGILCRYGSNPTITSCTISGNIGGGGIHCIQSNPIISDCTISGNGASGIHCNSNSNPTISDCTIEGNEAYAGGGIYCYSNSNPTISGCTVEGNTATTYGGGIYCYFNSSPTISDCTIEGNTADYYGGGIYCSNGNPTISGCTVEGNGAAGGGGIYCNYSSSPTLTDCTISNNTANGDGGGIHCEDSSPTLTNCEILNNTAGGLGGGLYSTSGSAPAIQDTSLCSNIPDQTFGNWTNKGGNTIADVCPWYQGGCCTGNSLSCVIATEEDCEYFGHTWLGEGTTCDDSPCPTSCLGDVNADGEVSINDLLTIIANWGPCP